MHTRFTRALVAVICCIVLVASCARLEVFATSTSNTKYSNLDSSKWNLVWSDEFNGNSLDTNTWNYEIGTVLHRFNGKCVYRKWLPCPECDPGIQRRGKLHICKAVLYLKLDIWTV